MLLAFIFKIVLPLSILAVPTIDSKKVYAVLDEEKKAIEDVAPFRDYYISVISDFESYNPPFKEGAKPNLSSHTEQLTSFRSIKERKDDAIEVRFEKLVTKNEMKIPGASRPFATDQDLSTVLKSKSFTAVYKNNELDHLEGVDTLKKSIEKEIQNPITKHAMLMTFDESILKKTIGALRQNLLCLQSVKGKKPGDDWTQVRKEQNIDVTYKCKFLGWSKNESDLVAIISFSAGKQKQEQKQPNGAIGVVEMENKGELIYNPKIPEIRITLSADIFAEPTKKEIASLEKKKKVVPRSKSKVKTWIQQYPY